MEKRLVRNVQDKKIAGVCAGLADYFDEEAYRDIFQKLQDEHYFDFHIEYRRFSDHQLFHLKQI